MDQRAPGPAIAVPEVPRDAAPDRGRQERRARKAARTIRVDREVREAEAGMSKVVLYLAAVLALSNGCGRTGPENPANLSGGGPTNRAH
jgi:hypothetical protein